MSRRASIGRLHRVHHGVYAVGHTALSLEARWHAAVLASGEGALLAGRAAAAAWSIVRVPPPVIVVLAPRQRRSHDGVTVRESCTLTGVDRSSRHGIPVTSVPRTLLDLGVDLDPYELANVVHEAEYRGALRPRAVISVLERNATHRGARSLRRALAIRETGSVGVRSRLELRFLRWLRAAGVPEPLVNTRILVGDEWLEVDLHWPDVRLCVEVDGPGHSRPRTVAEDRRRDALLAAAGWRVVRVAGRLEDVATVAELVAAGR